MNRPLAFFASALLTSTIFSGACSTSSSGQKRSDPCSSGDVGCTCERARDCAPELVCEENLCVPDRTGGSLGGEGGESPAGSGGEPGHSNTGGQPENVGGEPSRDEVPPSVVSSSPEGVLLDGRSPIVVTFSERIEAAKADIQVVLDTAINISGDVEVDGKRLIFRPTLPLASVGNYVVTVGTGVTDLSGNALAQKHTFDFDSYSNGRVSEESSRLDGIIPGEVSCPHLKMDANGNAMVLFSQGGKLFTSYYLAGQGWLATEELAEAEHGVLSMSPGGRAAVAYVAKISGEDQVLVRLSQGAGDPTFSNPILAGTGSLRPVTVDATCTLTQQGLGIAVNDDGAVAVSWRGMQPTTGDASPGLVTAVKPAGAGFGELSFTQTYFVETFTERPAIAIDGNGDAQLALVNWNNDPVIQRRSYDSESASWSNVADIALSGGHLVVAGVDRDDFFITAYQTFEFPDMDPFFDVKYANFAEETSRGGQHTPISTTGSESSVYLSTENVPWVTWMKGAAIGVSGYVKTDDRFDARPGYISDENASHPVIVGVDGVAGSETQGLLLFPSNGELLWSVVNLDPYNGGGAPVVKAVDLGGASAGDPRIAYDMGGKHGIILWSNRDSDPPELHATSFHRLPEATP